MGVEIDYVVSLNSPWTNFGAARIEALAARFNATLRIWPVDFGVVFSASGGLPLAQRSAQRKAYRMAELRRWRDALDLPVTLEPKHFPARIVLAEHCVIALRETGHGVSAVALAHRVLRALWQEEADPGDPATLAALIAEIGEDAAALLALAAEPRWAEQRAADAHWALARGVFGAPSYVIGDAIFWGQDRLDFVERELARDGAASPPAA